MLNAILHCRRMLCLLALLLGGVSAARAADTLDLKAATIAVADADPVVATAARMLSEEIAKRTDITLPRVEGFSPTPAAEIVLFRAPHAPEALKDYVANLGVPDQAEGFAIAVDPEAATVVLAGRDARGVLFAAGKLLLALRMTPGTLELPADFHMTTAPRSPIRGHQIAYRNLAHAYDAWTPEIYEQYMRELAVFGANSFETTAFQSAEGHDGPHMKLTQGAMAAEWSRICKEYGYDLWLFTSALGGTGESDEELEKDLQRRLEPLRAFPHIDHIYPTGGDGGSEHIRPDQMIAWTGRFAEEARKIHPGVGVWVSNQGFNPEQNNWFFDYLQHEQPQWLTGVVYGAWTRILADEQRARTPQQYPIRQYPDIGHCVRGQYPVAGWDRAFAQTLGREPFAPRPKWEARMHNLASPSCDGFVTYSDGVGDDVNKFVWTALGWDPERSVDEILLDYSRFFFGWDVAEQAREGLYRLESNFEGSLAKNAEIEKTYRLWKSLEDGADAKLLANWRFQECLLRANYDYYTQLRLLKANDSEARACAALRRAGESGVEQAIEAARAILAEPDQDEQTAPLRARIEALGAALFESIGAQLDVEHYKARNSERGAVLDFLDTPLNNKRWMEHEFQMILKDAPSASTPDQPGEGDLKLQRLLRVANWEDAGPGGFYDDLGCAFNQPHLVKPRPLWDDPAGITTPREEHTMDRGDPLRLSWLDVSEALNATPLVLKYAGLDPAARYRVRVTYLGRYNATAKLVADDQYEIHGAYGHTVEGVRETIKRDGPAQFVIEEDAPEPQVVPLEFPLPREATQDGALELRWTRVTGRGTQVAEVWLLRE